MSNYWGYQQKRELGEKAYRRSNLADWETRWHGLSQEARASYLNQVKGPVNRQSNHLGQPSVSADRFPPKILKELTKAGFVEIVSGKNSSVPERVFSVENLMDFTARLRFLQRHHPLAINQLIDLQKYLNSLYYSGQLSQVFAPILRKANIIDYYPEEEVLKLYVATHRWPGWVLQSLNDRIADQILEMTQSTDKPVPIAEINARFPDKEAGKVREVLDKLILHLALFEDLDPHSLDLVVGLLPIVRESIDLASRPRQRPTLLTCEAPKEVGPESSPLIDDLRAFLLEVASEPPRLRQDKMLFQKEIWRFLRGFAHLPPWLEKFLGWTEESRLNQALSWAKILSLVDEKVENDQIRLWLSNQGSHWLAGSLADQYASVFEAHHAVATYNDFYTRENSYFASNIGYTGYAGLGDIRFLGVNVLAKPVKPTSRRTISYQEPKIGDVLPLRLTIQQAFAALPDGIFLKLDRLIDHLCFGPHNPLLLGLDQKQVAVYWSSRLIPPLEEQFEEAGRRLLEVFLRSRLIPLGCLRTAIDQAGELVVARNPRLNAFFGQDVPAEELAGTSASESQVIVQPDFSIVIIGLHPTSTVELTPFCERPTKGGGTGALVLKLTRTAVVKAVANGLKPEEILQRLQTHASKGVPANVLKEVREWCAWVRPVEVKSTTILKCPDAETADRVQGAIRQHCERINETMVAINQLTLSAADRNKLRDHGILIQAGTSAKTMAHQKSRGSRIRGRR